MTSDEIMQGVCGMVGGGSATMLAGTIGLIGGWA